jgi:PKD repeat protein
LLAALVVLALPAAAQAGLNTPIPANQYEEPTYDFVDDDALFVYVLSDTKGGRVCVVHDVESLDDASCDNPAWGGANTIVGVGTTYSLIAAPPLQVGPWKLLSEDSDHVPQHLSETFYVSACPDCDRTFTNEIVQQWKAKAHDMSLLYNGVCAAFAIKSAGDAITGAHGKVKKQFERLDSYSSGEVGFIGTIGGALGGFMAFPSLEGAIASGQQKALEILNQLTCTLGQQYRDIVEDPPDPTYLTLFEPSFRPIDTLGADQTDDLAVSLDRETAFGEASLKAYERFTGAEQAGSDYGKHAQARQLAKVGEQFVAEMRANADALRDYAAYVDTLPEFQDAVVPDQNRRDVLVELYQRVSTTGFAQQELDELAQRGFTPAQIADIRTHFALDPASIPIGETLGDIARDIATSVEGNIDAFDMMAREASAIGGRTNSPPVANFDWHKGLTPLSVDFTDASTSPDLDPSESVTWDFGDGTSGSGANATHVYTNAGSYYVTQTVSDYLGATSTRQKYVYAGGGEIVIKKVTSPADTADPKTLFAFGGSTEVFYLSDGGERHIPVSPGGWLVNESESSEWGLQSIVCDDGASATPSTVSLLERAATINVEANETVTCTFTSVANRRPEWTDSTPLSLKVYAGEHLSAGFEATDQDAGQTVSIDGPNNLPNGAVFTPVAGNPATATLEWTPTEDDVGFYQLELKAHDDSTAQQTIARTVFLSVPKRWPLTVTKQGNSGGTVTSDLPGIDCGATCSAPYEVNTAVTLTATPGTNSEFAGWGGACTGTDVCHVTMSEARSVTATFNQPLPKVTLTTPSAKSRTRDPSPTYTGDAGTASGDIATVTVKVYDGAAATGTARETIATPASAGHWSVDGASLPDGVYTARAQQEGSNGIGFSAPHTFTVDTSAIPDNPRDSKGTDFWLAFPGNILETGAGVRSLAISGKTATSGTITIPGLDFEAPFTITPGEVTKVELPEDTQSHVSDEIERRGINVRAAAEVTVYALNRAQYTTDAYLGLPIDAIGTDYINLGYRNGGAISGSEFEVVSTEDNTQVTITPTVTVGARSAGEPYTITLHQAETYQLRASGQGDLSGTTIESTKPIGVFGGHACANIPVGYVACDHVVEQLPPTTSWGTKFLSMPLASRTGGDTFRIVAAGDATTVKLNGSTIATLNRGEVHEQIVEGPAQITANGPVLVMQYANGSAFDGANADPFEMMIPPQEQYLADYLVSTPASGFSSNFVNVVAPTSAIGQITLDGAPIPNASFTAIGNSGYSGAQLPVEIGSHALAGPVPFSVHSYGFDNYDSYGYPGGLNLAEIASVIQVALTPKSAGKAVGDEHCATATVTGENSAPLSDVRVDFTRTGPNSGSGFAFSDSNGHAQHCWTGTTQGTDTLKAEVGLLSDTAQVTWSPVQVPQLPSVSLTTPANGALTNDATPTYSGSAGTAQGDSATVAVEIWNGTTTTGDPATTITTSRSGGTWSADGTPALVDGTYTARAAQVGTAGTGHSSPHTFKVDTQAPAPTVAVPAAGALLTVATPTLSGAAGNQGDDTSHSADAPTVTVSLYSGPSVSGSPVRAFTPTRTGAAWAVNWAGTQPLPDGVYTARVTQSDAAGNLGTSATRTFTVDASPPTVTITQPVAGSVLGGPTVALAGTAGSAAGDSDTVSLILLAGTGTGGAQVQALQFTRTGGSWSGPSAELADGTYTAVASQADTAGNVGTSTPVTFSVDRTSPSVTITTPANGSSTTDTTPTVAGTAGNAPGDESAVKVSLFTGSTATGTALQDLTAIRSGTAWTLDTTALDPGTYTAVARQSDAVGNVGTSAPVTFTVTLPPPEPPLEEPPIDVRPVVDGSGIFCGVQHRGKCNGLEVTSDFSGPGNAIWSFGAFGTRDPKIRKSASTRNVVALGSVKKKINKAGKVTVVFKLKKNARTKKLFALLRKKKVDRLQIKLTYTPTGGKPVMSVTTTKLRLNR